MEKEKSYINPVVAFNFLDRRRLDWLVKVFDLWLTESNCNEKLQLTLRFILTSSKHSINIIDSSLHVYGFPQPATFPCLTVPSCPESTSHSQQLVLVTTFHYKRNDATRLHCFPSNNQYSALYSRPASNLISLLPSCVMTALGRETIRCSVKTKQIIFKSQL